MRLTRRTLRHMILQEMRRFINEQDDAVVKQKAQDIENLHHAGKALDREEAPLKDKPDLISWIDGNVISLETQTDLFDDKEERGAVLMRDQWGSSTDLESPDEDGPVGSMKDIHPHGVGR